jgi:hypothetical protein
VRRPFWSSNCFSVFLLPRHRQQNEWAAQDYRLRTKINKELRKCVSTWQVSKISFSPENGRRRGRGSQTYAPFPWIKVKLSLCLSTTPWRRKGEWRFFGGRGNPNWENKKTYQILITKINGSRKHFFFKSYSHIPPHLSAANITNLFVKTKPKD